MHGAQARYRQDGDHPGGARGALGLGLIATIFTRVSTRAVHPALRSYLSLFSLSSLSLLSLFSLSLLSLSDSLSLSVSVSLLV